ncbi:mitochondrial carrier domain-containing protein [Desarmillaria tabescens]|uniref:Mitochondrial carrier domain-containing protein n=1 Tax=Armillaria tabescens TaxID=1929756 RepID=A0AA39NGK7_ARMTA|nr:mitochondrial carrier domain-containing protein [Desarmillaria tabescens]KAK0465246.1 mitochondrial carrier domain-containing protein [Desarmillaria tabescens]
MNPPPSLRDLYNGSSSAWSFVPPPSPPSANSSPPASSSSSFQWSTRPTPNSIFDLSPDLNDANGVNAVDLLKTLAASAVLQYTSSAIAMPWEVGKMLLQVQWVPRDSHDYHVDVEPEDDDDALSDSSNDNESYFADPEITPRMRHPAQVDEHGYVIRRSVLEEGTRPEYIIPVGSANGVWGMIKRVGRFRGEGWLALWKGLLTSCCTEVLSTTFQPLIHNILQSLFLPTTPLFQQPPLLLPVASHIITGFLLSPLDLVRTRLIVQSYLPRYRSYKMKAASEESTSYPNLFIPMFIDTALRPAVSLALPGLLVSYLGANITEDSSPFAWGFAELAGSCIGLLITLPFETIRRRLQVQVRGSAKPIKGCVELRPAPYSGVVDALWHIITEERSDLPIIRRTKKRRMSRDLAEGDAETENDSREEDGWSRHTGIGQLYRGMGMRLGASVIVFFLALITGGDNSDGGWAEL